LAAFLVVAAVVHDFDPSEPLPYRPPQMRKNFGAFAAMPYDRARQRQDRAA
jgi:hypothetical protein